MHLKVSAMPQSLLQGLCFPIQMKPWAAATQYANERVLRRARPISGREITASTQQRLRQYQIADELVFTQRTMDTHRRPLSAWPQSDHLYQVQWPHINEPSRPPNQSQQYLNERLKRTEQVIELLRLVVIFGQLLFTLSVDFNYPVILTDPWRSFSLPLMFAGDWSGFGKVWQPYDLPKRPN